MKSLFNAHISRLAEADNISQLLAMGHGIEKEGLRVDAGGRLATSSHPLELGNSLTHPQITTDFSEAMLELVTPVYGSVDGALDHLSALHTQIAKALPVGEVLWNASMPAALASDDAIPIARFGSSNIGQFKSLYRHGLALRYGKAMQTIAGIHYNLSLSDAFWAFKYGTSVRHLTAEQRSAGYFGLIRNFRRYAWLLPYLFGATPAVDKSFFYGRLTPGLNWLDEETLYLPHATSLRMSNLGYSSDAQSSIKLSYDSLDEYVATVYAAMNTPYSDYQRLSGSGPQELVQLSSNLLQIENELYASIRPKQVLKPGESLLQGLLARGVEYVEVRNVDINPLMPLGMDAQQGRFLDLFLLMCALTDSPAIDLDEIEQNYQLSALRGREPGLQLMDAGNARSLVDWALELLQQLQPLAALLDKTAHLGADNAAMEHVEALQAQLNKVKNVDNTPSAKILQQLAAGQPLTQWVYEWSQRHYAGFIARELTAAQLQEFASLVADSHQQAQTLEAMPQIDFKEYLSQMLTGAHSNVAA